MTYPAKMALTPFSILDFSMTHEPFPSSSAGWKTNRTVPRGGDPFRSAAGAQDHGHVDVMATGVHPIGDLRGEREPRPLGARERIHLGTQRDCGPAVRSGPPTHAAAARSAVLRWNPEPLKLGNDGLRGVDLLERKLRVSVKVASQLDHALEDILRSQFDMHLYIFI